jgi:glycosyltransferase involved in cell wall biosynthesis
VGKRAYQARCNEGGAEVTPTVAVIISTYNAPEYLAKVLDGYLGQSRLPDELIVGDDGSDSCTAEVVSAFASKAKFPIRYVWQEDCGFRVAKIRNKAVKTSSAEYLIITDGDCVPHKRFIEDHIRVMRPGYFVQGKRMLVSKQASASFGYPGLLKLVKMCLKGEVSGCHHLLRIPGFTIRNKGLRGIKTCNFALYRKDFYAVNGLNEDFIGWRRSDSELAVRLFKYGLKRKDVPFSAIVFHLWHKLGSDEFLERNNMLLAEAIKSSSFYCKNGICKEMK